MMTNFEITHTHNFIKNKKFNCIQLCLADIASTMRSSSEHIFLEIWDFDLERPVCMGTEYDSSYQLLNERLIELLTIYAPIDYEKFKKQDISEASNKLKKDEIMLIEIDTYDCPWAVGYLWKHFTYYFIIKVDAETSKLIGYCPYDDVYNIEINDEIVKKAINAYIFKTAEKTCVLSSEQFKRHLVAKMEAIQSDTIFKKMERFANMLGNLEDIAMLKMDETRIDDNIFIQRLAYIESSRYGMQLLFMKLFNDETLDREMSEVCKQWTKFKNDIIKGIITKRVTFINKLKDDILVISNLEKIIFDKISAIDDRLILMQQ